MRAFKLVIPIAVFCIFPSLATAQIPGREYSSSAKEARRRATLISEVDIVPRTFKWKQYQVSFGQAWIEKSKSGGWYLCFHIDEGKEALSSWNEESGFFVLGDEESSILVHHFRDSRTLAVQYLESTEISNVRLSFVSGFKDQRQKNFRAIAKPTK